jgi:sugar lactone lactonase YvrE
LGSTFGNYLLDSVLYVSTPGTLFGLDAVTGETVLQKYIASWGNLDGITADTSGFLYIIDTGGRLLKLRLSDGEYWTFATGLGTSVQDCTFDIRNNRIVMVSYVVGKQIMAVGLNDSVVVNVTTNAPGKYDGVNIDDRGNFYVSTHVGGSVYR